MAGVPNPGGFMSGRTYSGTQATQGPRLESTKAKQDVNSLPLAPSGTSHSMTWMNQSIAIRTVCCVLNSVLAMRQFSHCRAELNEPSLRTEYAR